MRETLLFILDHLIDLLSNALSDKHKEYNLKNLCHGIDKPELRGAKDVFKFELLVPSVFQVNLIVDIFEIKDLDFYHGHEKPIEQEIGEENDSEPS